MGRMTLITGDERRRRWSEEDRSRILSEIEAPGAVVAEVARRADICTSLIYKSRREARKSASAGASGFAPVVIETSRSDRRQRPFGVDCGNPEGVAIVIPMPSGVRVWIATGHTDMRRGMQGLALQVQEQLKRDPHVGDLYIFRGRRGDLAKVLWHDGIGLSLYAKRLDRGKFVWPSAKGGVVSISPAQMAYMLEGIDWRNPQLTWRPKSAG